MDGGVHLGDRYLEEIERPIGEWGVDCGSQEVEERAEAEHVVRHRASFAGQLLGRAVSERSTGNHDLLMDLVRELEVHESDPGAGDDEVARVEIPPDHTGLVKSTNHGGHL